MLSSLDKVHSLLSWEASVRVAQFKRPQKVVCLFEARSDSVDLVDEILNTDDAEWAEGGLDNTVIRDRDSLLLSSGDNTRETTLVDQLSDSLQVGVSIITLTTLTTYPQAMYGPTH
jgi:hypothetical protein